MKKKLYLGIVTSLNQICKVIFYDTLYWLKDFWIKNIGYWLWKKGRSEIDKNYLKMSKWIRLLIDSGNAMQIFFNLFVLFQKHPIKVSSRHSRNELFSYWFFADSMPQIVAAQLRSLVSYNSIFVSNIGVWVCTLFLYEHKQPLLMYFVVFFTPEQS